MQNPKVDSPQTSSKRKIVRRAYLKNAQHFPLRQSQNPTKKILGESEGTWSIRFSTRGPHPCAVAMPPLKRRQQREQQQQRQQQQRQQHGGGESSRSSSSSSNNNSHGRDRSLCAQATTRDTFPPKPAQAGQCRNKSQRKSSHTKIFAENVSKKYFQRELCKNEGRSRKKTRIQKRTAFPPSVRGKPMTNSRKQACTRKFSPRMSPQKILTANFGKSEWQSWPKPETKKWTAFPFQEETKDTPNLDYLAQPQKRRKRETGRGKGKKRQKRRWSNDHVANVLKHVANAPCGIMILKTSVYSLPVHGVSKPLGLKGHPGGTLPRGPGEKPEPVVSQKGGRLSSAC